MWRRSKPAVAHWQEWMRHWAELNRVGLSALDALQLSRELQTRHAPRSLGQALQLVQQGLESGMDMVQAFRMGVKDLPQPLLTALQCAQASGNLAHALDTQLARWTKTVDAYRQLGRSLLYPVFVLLLSVLCWLLMASLHAPEGKPAPGQATAPMDWASLLMLAGACTLALVGLLRLAKPPQHLQHNSLLDPRPDLQLATHFHLMGCELEAGIDIIQCLKPRPGISRALNLFLAQIARHISQGIGLAEAMDKSGAPAFMVRQARMVENTGNMASCFFLAAKVYDLRAARCIQRLQASLPPLALGASAGILILAYQTHIAPIYATLGALP